MSAMTPQVHTLVLHDGSPLAENVVDTFAQFGSVDSLEQYAIPEAKSAADVWVIVASLREHRWIEKAQFIAKEQNIPVLMIGLEPGFVWLGPYVDPSLSGCFSCMRRWARNNNHVDHHWSMLPSDANSRRDTLPAAMSLPLKRFFSTLLAQYGGGSLLKNEHSLYRKVIRLDLMNSRTSEHRFISVVDCPTCSTIPDNSPETAMIQLQPKMKAQGSDSRVENKKLGLDSLKRDFNDRHIGLVKHVYYSLSSNLMPMFSAELPIMHTHEVESGYGRSETRENAEMVAILETLERHGGHSPKGQKTVVRGSYHQLKDNAINPRDLMLHDAEIQALDEHVLQPYSDDLEFSWVWCCSLLNDRPILIPEQSIFYYLLNTPETKVNRFIYETSNGCALGGALEEAIFYGLLELVERDAYLTTWYGQFTPREIDLRSIDDDRIQSLLDRTDARGLDLHVFDMRVGIDVPIVWCMIVDPAEDAPVKSYCAAGAHLVPENAIYSGLIEVTTSMGVYQESMPPLRDKALEMLEDDSKVVEMHDHVLLYSVPESYERLQFLFSDEPKASLKEVYGHHYGKANRNITEDLHELMDKVKGYADDVIVADLTFEELNEHQLYCVKVIAPGLMPVTFGHQYRRISLERINKYALASGKKPFDSVADLNPFPHNFP